MLETPWPQQDATVTSQVLKCPYILSKTLLGTGSYANVYECRRIETKEHYAAKRFSKKQVYGLESMLQREFSILKKVSNSHPNILSMVDYFETSDYFWLVTNLANGGELFERITTSPEGKLSVDETRDILSVLLSAIRHLHANGVVHRDIKAENILFSSKTSRPKSLLLADFGHSQILSPGECVYTLDGTLSYLAPEVLSRQGHSFPVDMWAVGVLAYFMLCGYMPFDCDTDKETKELISAADFVFEPMEYWENIPSQAKDFLTCCFSVDPLKRLTAEEALGHPFIQDISHKQIEGGFSQESLKKLHESMLKLQQSRQKSMVNLNFLQSPSKLSRLHSASNLGFLTRIGSSSKLSKPGYFEMTPLNGDKCSSPEAVTTLSTPVRSAIGSRQQSMTSLMAAADMGDGESTKSTVELDRKGQAKFLL